MGLIFRNELRARLIAVRASFCSTVTMRVRYISYVSLLSFSSVIGVSDTTSAVRGPPVRRLISPKSLARPHRSEDYLFAGSRYIPRLRLSVFDEIDAVGVIPFE